MKHYLTQRENGIWLVLSKEGSKRVALVSTKCQSKSEGQKFLNTYYWGRKLRIYRLRQA